MHNCNKPRRRLTTEQKGFDSRALGVVKRVGGGRRQSPGDRAGPAGVCRERAARQALFRRGSRLELLLSLRLSVFPIAVLQEAHSLLTRV